MQVKDLPHIEWPQTALATKVNYCIANLMSFTKVLRPFLSVTTLVWPRLDDSCSRFSLLSFTARRSAEFAIALLASDSLDAMPEVKPWRKHSDKGACVWSIATSSCIGQFREASSSVSV